MSPGYEEPLRWYPPAWRARYGDELAALLEDTYGPAGRVPRRTRFGLVRAGLAERAREAGLIGQSGGPAAQVRGGSMLVLWAWALFLVAGAMFGKFTDQWLRGTPAAHRTLPRVGFGVVFVAAVVGAVLVVAAAALVFPSFVRLVRAGRWPEVRGAVWRAVVAAAVATVFFAGTVAWSRGLSVHDRNGGLRAYSILFVLLAVAIVVAIAFGTAAAVAVARRVELSDRVVRTLGLLALGVTGTLALLFAGVVTWWAAEASHAPGVLVSGIGNGFVFASGTAPPTLVVAGLLMVLGLALAAVGSVRVLRALDDGRGHRPAT